jgi:Spy/CpxP family protein refolding chaperone
MKSTRRLVGAAVATAAATLFLAGMPASAAEEGVKVKRFGANECKGKSECKTSMSDKGQNACKGKGFVMMTEKDCIDRLGRR